MVGSASTGLPETGHVGEQPSLGTFENSETLKPPRFRQAPVLDNPHFRSPIPQEPEGRPLIRRSLAGRGILQDPPSSHTQRIQTDKLRQTPHEGHESRRVNLAYQQKLLPRSESSHGGFQQEMSSTVHATDPHDAMQAPEVRPWGEHLRRRTFETIPQRKFRGVEHISFRPQPATNNQNMNEQVSSRPVGSSHIEQADSGLAGLNDYSTDFIGFQDSKPNANAGTLLGDSVPAPVEPEDSSLSPAREGNHKTPISSTDGLNPSDSAKARRRAGRFASEDEPTTGSQTERILHPRRRHSGAEARDDDSSYGGQTTRMQRRQATDGPSFRSSARVDKPGRRSRDTKAAVARIAYNSSLDDDDFFDEGRSQARKQRKEAKEEQRREKELQRGKRESSSRAQPVEIPPFISINNLAALLKVRPEDFTFKLNELGFKDVSMDYVLNAETAGLIAMEYNFEPITSREEDADLKPRPAPADKSLLPQRPPIVTIMGHVDHGKTTLLDYLRHSSVAASEHGGITQHIGAFSVPLESHSNRLITFLDTPGHSAFLTMRQRGANVTDIVVLVVAADDSVKPQTVEAIKHSKAAGVQTIVAISKTDKEEADVQRVKQDLLRHEIEVEDFGGDVQAIEVSGKTGQGIADLEEAIITLADVLDVRAETDGFAEGWVLEATTKRAGRTATVLVRRGTLRPGNIIVAGKTWGRPRTLRNEAGVVVEEAGPGTPVEVDGWRDQPLAGDEVLQAPSEQKASAVVEFREAREERMRALSEVDSINETRKLISERQAREKEALAEAEATLAADESITRREKMEMRKAALFEANKESRAAQQNSDLELFFIIKADVTGSAEAVATAIDSLPLANQPIKVTVLRSSVGALSESDIALAAAAPPGQGYVLNFNQDVPPAMSALAAKSETTLLDANIIYKAIDDVREKIEEWLPPIIKARVTGEAEMLQAFDIKGERKTTIRVAGCRVNNGIVTRNSKVRVYRGGLSDRGTVVFDGE